jgi:signal recognition particle subunit SRP14
VLVRASTSKETKAKDGSRRNEPKTRISTVVQPDALEEFYVRYAEKCKAGMSALKKRDRTKRKKDKKKKGKAGVEKKT